MRKWVVVTAVLFLVGSFCGVGDSFAAKAKKSATVAEKQTTAKEPAKQSKAALKTAKDKVSYAFGMAFARNMKTQGIDLEPDLFIKAYKDTLSGAKPLLTDDEAQKAVVEFQTQMMAKKQEEMKKQGEQNKKAGDAYLAENKKKEGVVTLASGLQYKVLKEGEGNKPTADDKVKVNYKGSLIDGTEFDASEKHGGPAEFPVSGVIPGWTEAMQLMKVGSKWQIAIPSSLAYGEAGAGGVIPPNATLVFEVELLAISPPEPKEAPKAEGAAGEPGAAPQADKDTKQPEQGKDVK
jgi:FKBP-type peptidyl-prolyl cis-trans isomerase FklB